MLILELPTQKQAEVARLIRKIIEPESANVSKKLTELELRRELSKAGYTYYGFADIVTLLRAHYKDSTTARLVSKIIKPVVWDTCLTNLPDKDIDYLFYNTEGGIIFLDVVLNELLKLYTTSTVRDNPRFGGLLSKIITDNDSTYSTIVELPHDNDSAVVHSYTDDDLLAYCGKHDYTLCTYDYVLAIRARLMGIAVCPYFAFDIAKYNKFYTPTSFGRNVILHADLLKSTALSDVIQKAKSINANKFVVTRSFVEALENLKAKSQYCGEYIRFILSDSNNSYVIYNDDNANMKEVVDKYKGIVFSSEIMECITLKKQYIPYIKISASSLATAPQQLNETLNCSKSSSEILNFLRSLGSTSIEKEYVKIVQYKPALRQLIVKNLPKNEAFFVLDELGQEIPQRDSNYKILLNYHIIHVAKSPMDDFNITVYKFVNSISINRVLKLFKENYTYSSIQNLPNPLQPYAQRGMAAVHN